MPTVSRASRSPIARVASLFAIAATAVIASACSGDSLTQPDVAPQQLRIPVVSDVLQTLTAVTALTRDVPVNAPIVRAVTIDSTGGTITIPETGLKVTVPAGAIGRKPITITVTALAGALVAYDFQPHGTVFLKPLTFTQTLSNTSWDKLGFKGTINGGYFEDLTQLDVKNAKALLDELFPVTITNKTVAFDIQHFSGYMVSSGRQLF